MTLLGSFWTTSARLPRLAVSALRPGADRPADRAAGARRVLVLAAFLPLFLLVQLIHWVGLLLDEILFPGYRKVEIREPLFVLGVPRSGTTHLHRVLAQDSQYTTFRTWECLFALSVTARRFWTGLARLDTRLRSPLGRLLAWAERRAFGSLADVHGMGLADPEEDYFALMPVLAAFILILPFPTDPFLWRMGRFDRDMPEPERRRLMAFYRSCLQRHLYAHGPGKRLLSKNAAFAPLAGSLREAFPDARFLVCLREPARTLPSQLSSVDAGVGLFGVLRVAPDFRARLADQLVFYYENLGLALGDLPSDRCAWVHMQQLGARLETTVPAVYRQLGLPEDPAFGERLAKAATAAREYRSPHRYAAADLGLDPATIARADGFYRGLAARALGADGPGGRPGTAPTPPAGPQPGARPPTPSGAPLPC